MPISQTINSNPETLNRNVRFLFKVSCLLFCVFFLSACSLTGASKPAAIQVTSTPEASLFLDGKHIGKTPFFSDQLKEGTHDVKITAGSASFTTKVDLHADTLTVVSRQLNDNQFAQSGEILWLEDGSKDFFVASSPTEVDITIDGIYRGKTPIQITDLPSGDHKVVATKDNYIEHEFAIKTSSKYKLMASLTLASEIAKVPSTNRDTPQVQKVEILKTPQGYLRVRKDPDLNSTEIGRVNTADQLEVIQETEEWIKISTEGKFGWISKQYTKKV